MAAINSETWVRSAIGILKSKAVKSRVGFWKWSKRRQRYAAGEYRVEFILQYDPGAKVNGQ